MMSKNRTIKIIGGGLAGLSLGIALRYRNIPVEIHEAGYYPRHRVCGEFISGVTDETLADLGILDLFDDVLKHHTIKWFKHDALMYTGKLPNPARAVSRYKLDLNLAKRFRELGGVLKENSRAKVISSEGTVICCGRKPEKESSWIGLKMHVENFDTCADLEMHMGEYGYVGLSKVENGYTNICGLFKCIKRTNSPKNKLLLSYLKACNLHSLASKMNRANIVENSISAVAAFHLGWQNNSNNQNLLCLGDHCTMIPPFTGNGMSMAFESAALSIEPLVKWYDGALLWPEVCHSTKKGLYHKFRRRILAAQSMHFFLTNRVGQKALHLFCQNHLLPFTLAYRAVR
ncbi:MAG: hypothetical protein AAF984_08055 [Verrucomicrobiota bacterium]